MELTNVVVESDFRCSAVALTEILKVTPIQISGDFENLKIRMGLGRIVYILPINGSINKIDYGQDVKYNLLNNPSGIARFSYKNNNFSVFYNSSR